MSNHPFIDTHNITVHDFVSLYAKQYSEGEEMIQKKPDPKKQLDLTKSTLDLTKSTLDLTKTDETKSIALPNVPLRRGRASKKINKYKMYDVIWGMIELPIEVKCLIDHRYYNRLEHIAQLSIMKFIIPTANHDRLQHSIGVAHLCYIAALHLHTLYPDEAPIEHAVCVACAGVSHDVGHGMFSHAYDHLLNDQNFEGPGRKHEYRSIKIFEYAIKEIMALNPTLCFTEDLIYLVQYFIDQEKYKQFVDPELVKLPKFKKGLEQIVNNYVHKVDVDKMDYILRDSKHMGIPYSNNQDSIITMLQRTDIINETWVFDIRDRRTIELLLHQRYTLYSNYYVGDKSLGMACMLNDVMIDANKYIDIVSCANLKDLKDVETFCSLTDDKFLLTILNMQEQGLKRTSGLIENIMMNKNCYSIVDDFVENSNEQSRRSGYRYVPVSLFTDKSNPEQALSKIIYHNDGDIIDQRAVLLVREISTKIKKRN